MKSVICPGVRVSFLRVIALFLLCSVFSIPVVQSQTTTYLSSFPDPTGQYSIVQPGCTVGTTPGISNGANVSSSTLSDFATLNFQVLSLGVGCSGQYRITANLNFQDPSITSVDASPDKPYNAGFKVRVSELLRAALVGNNMQVATYLGAARKESSQVSLLSLGLLDASGAENISITATQPFDRVAVEISSTLIAVGAVRTIDFFYAFASTAQLPVILPVKLTSFSAIGENKNVAINWTTASETNVAKYELQRSSDGGTTFNTITTIAAKGTTTTETKYNFADGTAITGNYTYRLKMVDKDGGAEYSKLALVKISTNAHWKIYPTLLSSGTDLNVSLVNAGSGKTQIQLANLQGQVLRTTSSTTNSKLTITTNSLSAGVYILKLYKDGQLQASEKVVIQ